MRSKALVNMAAALAMGVASFGIVAAPAQARGYHDRGDYHRSAYRYRDYRGDYGYRGYRGDRRAYGYRGYRCRDNGTGGAIIGAIAGGLLGRTVDGGRDRTTGTILGAGAGALIGAGIDKSDGRRC